MEQAMVVGIDESDCHSCEQNMPKNKCPKSLRQCGHHCNHSWTHDVCCWCAKEFGEEET